MSERVPVKVVTEVAFTATVVLPFKVFNAPASTDASVTVMVYGLPVPVKPAKVAMSPVEIVAVMVPLVNTSRAFACAEVIESDTIKAAVLPSVMPPEPIAVVMSALVPVKVVIAVATTATVVFASSALSADAATVVSVTVMV